jgi:hypothetical protein
MPPGIPERQTHALAELIEEHLGLAAIATTPGARSPACSPLETATGQVTDACYPHHRHQLLEFVKNTAASPPPNFMWSTTTTPPTSTPRSASSWPLLILVDAGQGREICR